MKILIFTYSITRKAGGVFNAVCDLFTNKAFTGEEIKIFHIKMKMFSKIYLVGKDYLYNFLKQVQCSTQKKSKKIVTRNC